MTGAAFAPSQVVLGWLPLTGTMGRVEREAAAALIVRACQVRGDKWQPVSAQNLGEVLAADLDAKVEPWHSLNTNPFWRPDFWELVEHGFARWCDEPGKGRMEFTENGIAALARWVRPSPEPSTETKR